MSEARIAEVKRPGRTVSDLSRIHGVADVIRSALKQPPCWLPFPDRMVDRIEWCWQNDEAHLLRMDWLVDNAAPCLDSLTGPAILARTFGRRLWSTRDSNPTASRMIQNAAALQRPDGQGSRSLRQPASR